MRSWRRSVRVALLVGGLGLASACATPIGVDREDHTALYRTFTHSALSGSEPSLYTTQLLRRHGLERRFEQAPEAVIAELRGAGADVDADRMFVLAELSFLYGERARRPEHSLAAAVYALGFLSHPTWRAEGMIANAVDPRARMACDFYNIGLVRGLQVPHPAATAGEPLPPSDVLLTDRTLALPFGELELRTKPETFLWGGYRFSRFISTAEYEVRGLRNRYRQAGVGAPLVAEVIPVATGPQGELDRKRIPPRVKVPITAIVRIESVIDGIANGRLQGTVEINPADAGRTTEINGVRLPLELDPTASLGLMPEGAPIWNSEIGGFLKTTRPVLGDGLIMLQPYRRDRVPVVLVHGTASSPARWAEIINEVQNDPMLGHRVQMWLFMYNTSNPILFDPLPFVTRVVFLATPHRGSYRANRLALNLVRRVVTLPGRLIRPVEDIVQRNPGALLTSRFRLPTAVDNMSPRSRFVRTLSECPIDPRVTTHSIIAVQGSGDLLASSDGVVRYESAHLAGTASERVVHSQHSLQSNPDTIVEVRRILREHLGVQAAAGRDVQRDGAEGGTVIELTGTPPSPVAVIPAGLGRSLRFALGGVHGHVMWLS